MWEVLLPFKINQIIYLKTDVETCMRRIKLRNRDGESKITKEYQMRLERSHDNLFTDINIPVWTTITTSNFLSKDEKQNKICGEILNLVVS